MQINADKSYDIYKIIKEINASNEQEITVSFSKDCEVYKNASNLLIIKHIVEEQGKSINFSAENPGHAEFMSSVNEDRIEFLNPEIDITHESAAKAFSLAGIFAKVPNPIDLFKKADEGVVVNDPDSAIDHNVISYSESGIKKLIKPIIILSIVFGAILGLFYLAMYFVPSSTVTINLKTDALVKLLEVKAVKDGSVSAKNRTIPALEIQVSESDTQSAKVTGKKVDGVKANGKVTLTNKKGSDIKIKKGTEIKLISSKDDALKYVTTEEVTVPKKTEEDDPVNPGEKITTYGTKEVKVQAVNFGSEYNKDKGEKFEVGDYDTDELIAENDKEKFEGGKLEEKLVVSQTDMDSLKKTVEDSIKEKLVEALKRKTISTQKLMDSTIKYETTSANYSKKLDEETEDLSLTVVMSATAIAYSEEDLDGVVKEVAKTVVPEEFNLDGENIDYEVAATMDSNSTDTINLQVKLRSYIFPKVDLEQVRRDLAGKSLTDAQNYINDLQNVAGFEINITPQLPAFLMRMPVRAENIRVKIEK